ncbi:type VII secretion protein EccB, partial [Salmonella enterica]|uniref:type VII secretion protein EccB n=1 Tax=Salmonella enterica TaxID=28901 RepID=UPI0035C83B10
TATVVSPKLLNATLPQPALSVPRLEGFGSASPAVQGYDVGTVFAQEMPNQPSVFYVVTNRGIQTINEVIGRILVTGGAQIVRNP